MIGTKKGQAGAAVLVALIAVLIIMYVLFLPPADRAALLGETTPGAGGTGTPTNILFSTPVGRVFLPGIPAQQHTLPALAVRTVEAGTVLGSSDQVTVRNSAFDKQPQTILFTADPQLTRNVVLSFNIASRTGGNVIVEHNGVQIYNQDVRSRSVTPIPLTLAQGQNNLTFSASSVGFSFWTTNTYTLSNVMITGDVKDLSAATARQVFAIAADEYLLLDKVQLSFVPVCNREGKLSIMLNSVEIFSGVPDCGSMNTLEIAPNKLVSGENTITFNTQDGDFIIDAGTIRTQGKQQSNRVFRFAVEPTVIQGRQVNLRVMFADATEHRGNIIINGNTLPLRAQDLATIPITQYIRAGENTIQFEAANKDFEVVKFDVLRT